LIDWGEEEVEPEELKVPDDHEKNAVKKFKFLEMNKEKLFNFEIAEIKALDQELIYFAGQSANRTQAELNLLKAVHEK
jgi:hypothetical protein